MDSGGKMRSVKNSGIITLAESWIVDFKTYIMQQTSKKQACEDTDNEWSCSLHVNLEAGLRKNRL